MDSVNRSAVTTNKSRLARAFAKVLHAKSGEKAKNAKPTGENRRPPMFFDSEDEKLRDRAAMDAFLAKLFATISSVKAAYAQLQYAQSPYDGDGIQSADRIVVSELKNLSELKQSYVKKHLDDSSPETTRLLAEIQELKSVLKTYEITRKKLDSLSKLKDSEIIFLKEKSQEIKRENKRLNSSGPLSKNENLDFSSVSVGDFVSVLKQTRKSVRSFVRFLIGEMEYADWDLDAAANSIQPEAVYWDETHKCYAFESFVCREMFNGFDSPEFSNPRPPRRRRRRQRSFFDMFTDLKPLKPIEYITWKPTSTFAGFCRSKYLRLVHPKMESSLFGNLYQGELVAAGKFPETAFFTAFAEVAKWIWLLHCLAFSFVGPDEAASIFQVAKGSRFSEVFMESVNEEAFMSPESSPEVGFTVVPGFVVGKTVIQCQVYLT